MNEAVSKFETGVFRMVFEGNLSWDDLLQYHVRLAELVEDKPFVMIADFRQAHRMPAPDLSIVQYAQSIRGTVHIVDAVVVGASTWEKAGWKMLVGAYPGMVERLHFADDLDDALTKARELLS